VLHGEPPPYAGALAMRPIGQSRTRGLLEPAIGKVRSEAVL
jgi:hypothetical protein